MALETHQFVIDNQPVIHSVELFYFVAYRHTPMVRNPDKFGALRSTSKRTTICPGLLLALNDPSTLSCLNAMQLCEEFYKNDFSSLGRAREHGNMSSLFSKVSGTTITVSRSRRTAVGSPKASASVPRDPSSARG